MNHRTLIPTVVLLVSLAILTLLAVGPTLPGQPICGSASALAVLPLGVDWPEGRLAAYGRSAAAVRPGDVLCVALSWETPYAAGDTPPTVRVDVVGPDGQTAARYEGPAAVAWGANVAQNRTVGLRVDRHAVGGSYLISLSVVDSNGGLLPTLDGHTTITVGTVLIDPAAPPQAGVVDAGDVRGLEFRGRLSEWPFWPHPVDDDEDA